MRRPFVNELLLAVVTLGLYMPYWLWARNDELRRRMGGLALARNEGWLAGGIVLATFARAVFGGSNELIASFLSTAGIVVFAFGAYVFAENVERSAESTGVPVRLPPWVFGAGLGIAFLGVEAGNAMPTWTVRGPALALMFATPFLFYAVHETLEDVRERIPTPS